MDVKEVANLTSLENVTKHLEAIIGREGLEYEAEHNLFIRGVLAGMESLMLAIGESVRDRKLLENRTDEVPDDKYLNDGNPT